MEITARPRRRGWWRALRVLVTVAAVASVLLLVPAALGFSTHVVGDDAMAGTYSRGALVFDEQVQMGELEAGDVVTFTPPGATDPVTRRVTGVSDGMVRTRGDASDTPDPWRVPEVSTDRVAFSVPWLGWPLLAVDSLSVAPWAPAGVALGTAGLLVLLRRTSRGTVEDSETALVEGVAVAPTTRTLG
jgi:signal peptidase I